MLKQLRAKAAEFLNPGATTVHEVDGGNAHSSEQSKILDTANSLSIVMAAVNWITAGITATPWRVIDKDGVPIENDHITNLINTPNKRLAGAQMRTRMAMDWCLYGNVFIEVRSDRTGIPRALIPRHYKSISVLPGRDGEVATAYAFDKGNGTKRRIMPRNMLHIRRGSNPECPIMGVSPLSALITEVWIDVIAGRYTGDLLANWGVPGLIVSPEANAKPIGPAVLEDTRNFIAANYGTGKRGDTLVLRHAMKIQHLAFNPSELNLSDVRNISEERVAAIYGLSAAVIGFGTGLEKADTRATHRDMRKQSWVDGILPIQRSWAEQMTQQLLSKTHDIGPRIEFDTRAVEELQPERAAEAQRWQVLVSSGIATRAEARRAHGLEVRDGDDIYLFPAAPPDTEGCQEHSKLVGRRRRKHQHSRAGRARNKNPQPLRAGDLVQPDTLGCLGAATPPGWGLALPPLPLPPSGALAPDRSG